MIYYSVYTYEGDYYQTYVDKELAKKVAIVRSKLTGNDHYVAEDLEDTKKYIYGVYATSRASYVDDFQVKLFYLRDNAVKYMEARNADDKENLYYIMELEIE